MNGFVSNLDFAEYLKTDAISASSIKLFRESPAKYDLQKRGLYKPAESKAFKLGKAFEILVLEPEKSDSIIITECATEGVKEFKDAVTNNPGKIILTAGDGADVRRWARCCESTIFTNGIRGEAQVSAFYADAEFGVIKCRYDLIDHDTRTIYDTKLMTDASPEQFAKDAYRFGYNIQSWWYRYIAEKLTGHRYRFRFIAQEKHDMGDDDRFTGIYEYYETDDAFIEPIIKSTVRKMKLAQTLGEYDGYGSRLIGLPAWSVANV